MTNFMFFFFVSALGILEFTPSTASLCQSNLVKRFLLKLTSSCVFSRFFHFSTRNCLIKLWILPKEKSSRSLSDSGFNWMRWGNQIDKIVNPPKGKAASNWIIPNANVNPPKGKTASNRILTHVWILNKPRLKIFILSKRPVSILLLQAVKDNTRIL